MPGTVVVALARICKLEKLVFLVRRLNAYDFVMANCTESKVIQACPVQMLVYCGISNSTSRIHPEVAEHFDSVCYFRGVLLRTPPPAPGCL